FRQVQNHPLRFPRLATHNQSAKTVECVEQEMRVNLIAQASQFCILGGLCKTGSLAFHATNLSGIAERQVKRGPADYEEKARNAVLDNGFKRIVFHRHIFAHSREILFIHQAFGAINIENIIIKSRNSERTRDRACEGCQYPDGKRLVLKLPDHEIKY